MVISGRGFLFPAVAGPHENKRKEKNKRSNERHIMTMHCMSNIEEKGENAIVSNDWEVFALEFLSGQSHAEAE